MTVTAVDPDSDSNGVVTYELVQGDASLFKLNRLTGSLQLRRTVASLQPRYRLTIRATDEAIQSPDAGTANWLMRSFWMPGTKRWGSRPGRP